MIDSISSNKIYKSYNFKEDTKIFTGYPGDFTIDTSLLSRIAKDLGFSYDLYITLYQVSPEAADSLVRSMSIKSKHEEVILLIDEDENEVVDYSLDTERLPLLNSEFLPCVSRIASTSDDIYVAEHYYLSKDKVSSVILRKKSPVVIEERYLDKESKNFEYDIGVAIFNDEVNSAYTRLVVYVEGQPLYLPASYYNTTTSRYRRSTYSSVEALEVLILKIIDDLRDEYMLSKIQDLHYQYRYNKNILSSYEEYNTLLRYLRKIPTIIEDSSYLDSIVSRYEDFEKKYSSVEDQKSSYIWRCTAISDISLGALIHATCDILNSASAPSIEYLSIRELLGTYMSTNRIADEIAKETIR